MEIVALLYLMASLLMYAWMWLSDRRRVRREPWLTIFYAAIWPVVVGGMIYLVITRRKNVLQ